MIYVFPFPLDRIQWSHLAPRKKDFCSEEQRSVGHGKPLHGTRVARNSWRMWFFTMSFAPSPSHHHFHGRNWSYQNMAGKPCIVLTTLHTLHLLCRLFCLAKCFGERDEHPWISAPLDVLSTMISSFRAQRHWMSKPRHWPRRLGVTKSCHIGVIHHKSYNLVCWQNWIVYNSNGNIFYTDVWSSLKLC